MPFIQIHPQTLDVSVTPRKPTAGVYLPTSRGQLYMELSPLYQRVYFGTIYSLAYERMSPEGRRKKHSLTHPDPWLVALGGIIWEGLLQGMSWDLVKAAARAALAKLQAQGLAPQANPASSEIRSTASKTEIGFTYTTFATDGDEQERFFLGVKRSFERTNEIQRIEATRPEEYERLRQEYLRTHHTSAESLPKPKKRPRIEGRRGTTIKKRTTKSTRRPSKKRGK